MLEKQFKFRDHTFQMKGPDNCSVMRSIESTGQFYEAEFLEALEQAIDSKKWVIDVGAHIGNHSIFWAKNQDIRVLAFEPNPKTFHILKENIEANGVSKLVSVLNLAVADKSDVVTLTPLQGGDPGTFSVLRPSTESSIRCKAVLLDDYLEYFEVRRPGLIKIDVEGAEVSVLRGAQKTLQIYRPLVTTEVTDPAELEEIGKILSPLGYAPIGVYNATPTIMWSARTPGSTSDSNPYRELLQITSYAVAAAMNSNIAQRTTRNLQEKLNMSPEAASDVKGPGNVPDTTTAKKTDDTSVKIGSDSKEDSVKPSSSTILDKAELAKVAPVKPTKTQISQPEKKLEK